MPTIEIRGNVDLRKALRSFAPDLEKQLKKDLAAAMKPVVAKARGFAPANSEIMSGWQPRSFSEARFPFYNASTIKAGIVYSSSPSKINPYGFSSMATITNKSAAGAIYETAGRNGPQPWVGPKAEGASNKVSRSVNRKAGATFINNLPELTSSLKGRGRLIFRAWAQDQGRAEGAALTAIDKTTRAFNEIISKGKLSRAA
jgi:hypothetical protein